MNQARVDRLISKLKISLLPKARKLRNVLGPEGRLLKLRKTVNALVKYERIELNLNRGDEARGYAERLISDAIRYGPDNPQMMRMANYWMIEKQLVYKLFYVLVPRYENYTTSFTEYYACQRDYPGIYYKRCIIELKGNPLPPIQKFSSDGKYLLHNILLNEAKKSYFLQRQTFDSPENLQ